jgi:hypothetical protein
MSNTQRVNIGKQHPAMMNAFNRVAITSRYKVAG